MTNTTSTLDMPKFQMPSFEMPKIDWSFIDQLSAPQKQLDADIDRLSKLTGVKVCKASIASLPGQSGQAGAAALPGGCVVVNREFMKEDQEVRDALLLHEIGHIKYRHPEKLFAAMIIAGVIVNGMPFAIGVKGVLGYLKVSMSASTVVSPSLAEIRYRCEYAADAFAVKHGGGPGLIRFFENSKYVHESRLAKWCRTLRLTSHPQTEHRIARIKAAIAAA